MNLNWFPSICLIIFWAFSVFNPLFWDTIQFASYHPTYYFENNFNQWFLPAHLDSGHPPYFGLYIALCWKLLGRELWVTHLAMLPAVLAIAYFLQKLSQNISGGRLFSWMFVCFTGIIGQIMLVSPDVLLVLFWLLGIYGIINRQKTIIIFSVILLGMISMRGMVAAVGLFLWQGWIYRSEKNNLLKTIYLYIPGGLLAMAYFVAHYFRTKWIGYHTNSTWADSFLYVDFHGFLKNIIVLGWRLNDFGVFIIWLSIIYILFKQKIPIKSWLFELGNWGVLLIINLILFAAIMLPYTGLMGHRYLLPVYISLFLVWAHIVQKYPHKKFAIIGILGIVLGNICFYPQPIATGWDSTPLHVFYFPIRQQCINYLKNNNIPLETVGSAFPNLDPLFITDLSAHDSSAFVEKNLNSQNRIFYSNIFNNFTDSELQELHSEWVIEKDWSSWPITGILYKKPKPSDL